MDFENISGVIPVSSLNTIILNRVRNDVDFGVSLVVGGNEVFNDSLRSCRNQLKIFGIGDIIIDASAYVDVVSPECSLTVSYPEGGGQTMRFTALVTKFISPTFERAGVSNIFLSASNVSVCPTGAEVCLTALGNDVSVAEQPELIVKSEVFPDFRVSPVRSGMAAVYKFNLPDSSGVFDAILGLRRHTFFVTDIYEPHSLAYTNFLNAPEILWLKAKVTLRTSRSSLYATVSGEGREYDVNVIQEFDFSAKGVLPATAEYLKLLPFSNDILIDGVPVMVSEMNTEHSREAADMFDVKFTARLRQPRVLVGDISTASRIFRSPFDRSFN